MRLDGNEQKLLNHADLAAKADEGHAQFAAANARHVQLERQCQELSRQQARENNERRKIAAFKHTTTKRKWQRLDMQLGRALAAVFQSAALSAAQPAALLVTASEDMPAGGAHAPIGISGKVRPTKAASSSMDPPPIRMRQPLRLPAQRWQCALGVQPQLAAEQPAATGAARRCCSRRVSNWHLMA